MSLQKYGKTGTSPLSQNDIVAYAADSVFCQKLVQITLPAITYAGSCIDATSGAAATSASTKVYVVLEDYPAGTSQTIRVANPFGVVLREAVLQAADAAGLTKAKTLLIADGFRLQ
ncbi:TPA: hypothetical protein PXN30_001806 [Yersinia enterocolitica]|uniref:hypothetical protein n=1 Tax=Yersinia mollaretii TaxID=33060 RepID=UPI0005E400A8|nr:hypothetical protein [Yersinia mollaretii]EKN3510093.1 hypothetical protein [Yersinia enterocolitica]EKN3697600.1 hypothetical protein [Yersinia enterocolitica]EKN3721796.1 hypothetical protein [Yersinia enterocolitica]EKN3960716.1 hypothetical protein [Yersinia enterocolitica]EKN4079531.1 hypothetical protein [Yersinia enterocolitica]